MQAHQFTKYAFRIRTRQGVVVNAVAIWVAAFLVPKVSLTGEGGVKTVLAYLVVGAIFGLVNTFIKPIVKFFAFPFVILTLGLLSLVINAAMLKIVDWASGKLGIAFDCSDNNQFGLPLHWKTLVYSKAVRVKEGPAGGGAIIHFRVVKNYRGKKVPVRGDIFLGLRDTYIRGTVDSEVARGWNPQDCSDSGIFIARR